MTRPTCPERTFVWLSPSAFSSWRPANRRTSSASRKLPPFALGPLGRAEQSPARRPPRRARWPKEAPSSPQPGRIAGRLGGPSMRRSGFGAGPKTRTLHSPRWRSSAHGNCRCGEGLSRGAICTRRKMGHDVVSQAIESHMELQDGAPTVNGRLQNGTTECILSDSRRAGTDIHWQHNALFHLVLGQFWPSFLVHGSQMN